MPRGAPAAPASSSRAQNRLQTEQILLVEDEPYALTRFEGERLPALFDFSGRRSIYSSSFSATIAPGLRVGWLILPDSSPESSPRRATRHLHHPRRCSARRRCSSSSAAGASSRTCCELRERLRERRDALLAALAEHLPEAAWSRPEGGFFVVARAPGDPRRTCRPGAARRGSPPCRAPSSGRPRAICGSASRRRRGKRSRRASCASRPPYMRSRSPCGRRSRKMGARDRSDLRDLPPLAPGAATQQRHRAAALSSTVSTDPPLRPCGLPRLALRGGFALLASRSVQAAH